MVTDDTETFIDPWTRKPIVDDPITNRWQRSLTLDTPDTNTYLFRKCGHTYEKATVMRFLEK